MSKKSFKLRTVLAMAALSICVASTVHAGKTTEVSFEVTAAGGAEGGTYDKVARATAAGVVNKLKRGKVRTDDGKVKLVTDFEMDDVEYTNGTLENVDLLENGEVMITVLQADTAANAHLPDGTQIFHGYHEKLYWMYNPKVNVKDFGKMENKSNYKAHAIALVDGSGAISTLRNFATHDEDYAKIRVVRVNSWTAAARAVADGKVLSNGTMVSIAGTLAWTRPGKFNAEIMPYASRIAIGELNDNQFDNAKDATDQPLYKNCEVEGSKIKGFIDDYYSDQNTLCMESQVVVAPEFFDQFPSGSKVERKVEKAVAQSVEAAVSGYRTQH